MYAITASDLSVALATTFPSVSVLPPIYYESNLQFNLIYK